MLFLFFDQESSESANTTIEDEDVRGREVQTPALKRFKNLPVPYLLIN